MFYAIIPLKYTNRKCFGWSEKGILGLNNELGWKFDQNNFRYEFPDLENVGVDTLTKPLGIILCVLCIYVSKTLKISLPRMGT